jgi:hypothetical protein
MRAEMFGIDDASLILPPNTTADIKLPDANEKVSF